ncbi:hypothetical protein [uncultured Sphingopyxis sp.]|uniref:hypothetical protein n=1 Tax=uncultured Sphingopyxis sp. TaxID=310581 RepID=UPI002592725C|nr:hypothetical protein [uncultured Sphingopyxis sp.]
MTSHYIGFDSASARLKKYTATATSGTGGKSLIRIEIEVTGHWELGDVLHQLQRIESEQKAAPPRRADRTGDGK